MAYNLNQEMLTLAAIIYRGYYLTLPNPAKHALMYQAMTDGLHELGPVKDQWEIVWGPASFSSTVGGFDDAAMYVARKRAQPATFVVAVRGTNPLSPFDWIFGDLLVTHQWPWPYGTAGADGAKISLSTALGLRILQHLRSQAPQPGLRKDTSGMVQRISLVASGWLQSATAEASQGLRTLGATLHSASQLTRILQPLPLKEAIEQVRQRLSTESVCGAQQTLRETLQRFPRLDPLDLITGDLDLQQAFGSGTDLQSFLRDSVAQSNDPT